MENLGSAHETIVVNDGSTDETWQQLLALTVEYPSLQAVNLMRNYGQHNALLVGLRAAQYGRVVTLDADLQNPPEEIPKLLAKLDEGYDVVYGTPEREQHGLWRDLASRTTKIALQSAMGAETARKVSAFRAIRTEVRDAFAHYQNPYVNLDVLLTWGTARFGAAPVKHEPRRDGVSKYNLLKLVTHALNMVTGFSTAPLRLATLVGFAFTLFGIAVLAYVLARFLFEHAAVPGFPFLASAIAIFSGAQLFALGIMGEYLARMHMRMMERPTYTVRERVGGAAAVATSTASQ
jgi:undecaprenyl-phosphate 4-deoxy-4-formamido-L-arabinose transferase